MKKLFWLILAMCLLVVPAMAEECDHEGAEWSELWAPDCTHPGGEGAWCNKCMTYVTRDIPAPGHDKSLLVETQAPTCSATGLKSGVCAVCGEDVSETLPKLEHTVTEWTIVAGPAPCVGRVVQKFGNCEVCGEEEWVYESCEPTGEHEFPEKGVVVEEPTCTEPGRSLHLCKLCGNVSEEREIPALGHTVTEWETMWEPAECSGESGMQIGVCEVCGEDDYKEIPFEGEATGVHVFSSYREMEPATCTEPGMEMSLCALCGREDDMREIPALGHDESRMIEREPATCTEPGLMYGHCPVCEAELFSEIPALGHTVTEWEIVAEPAACKGFDGLKVGICDTCGEEIWEDIPFEGEIIGEHVYENWEVTEPATCTEVGQEISFCSYCGRETESREIPALGHDDSEMEVTKEATCEEAGEKVGKCSRCGLEGEAVEIPALGHDHVWETTKEATCEEDGEKTGVCSRCDDVAEPEVIPALGHDEGEWVVVKKATREEEGLKELQCTRCAAVLDSEVIPMVTIAYYPNNTACLDGVKFRNLENPVTNKWYTFVEVDLSQDGVQVFDLIASNVFRIGTVTLTVSEGTLTVDYDLISNEIVVDSEFLTLFASLEDVTTVDQAAFTNYAYGEPINIQEALNGTTGYIYLCNGVSYHDQIPGLVRVWGR